MKSNDLLDRAMIRLRSKSHTSLHDRLELDEWSRIKSDSIGLMLVAEQGVERLVRCVLCDGLEALNQELCELKNRISDHLGDEPLTSHFDDRELQQLTNSRLFIAFDLYTSMAVFGDREMLGSYANEAVHISRILLARENINWPSIEVLQIENFEPYLVVSMLAEITQSRSEQVLKIIGDDKLGLRRSIKSPHDALLNFCKTLALYDLNKAAVPRSKIHEELALIRNHWLKSAAESVPFAPLYLVLFAFLVKNLVMGHSPSLGQLIDEFKVCQVS